MAVPNDSFKKSGHQRVIIIGIILSLFMQILFVSCSNDNEEYNSEIHPNITVNGKYLVRINSSDLIYNAQGELVKVKFNNTNGGTQDYNYSYEAKRIILGFPYDVIYYLNGGRITECRYTVFLSDLDDETVDEKVTYEYDKNGYLIKQIGPKYDYTEEDSKPEITVYEWRDGNIQKITRTDDDWVEETTFSYTSFANTIPEFHGLSMGNYLGWQGYFGKRCKNLPASETISYPNDFDNLYNPITYNYEYTIEDGLVTKVTVKRNSSTIVHELEWY